MDLFDAVNSAMSREDEEPVYEPPTREVEHLTYAARAISSAGYMIGHLDNNDYDYLLETLAGLMGDLLQIDGVADNYVAIASGEYQTAMFHKLVLENGNLGDMLAGLDMDDLLDLDDLED